MGSESADRVMVRFWAGARAAAEVESESVPIADAASGGDGVTVGDVLARVVEAHPALATIVPVCSLLVDGAVVRPDAPATPGATIEVLPPFAGG